MKKLIIILGMCAATMSMTAQIVRYVTPNGAGNTSGSSWANASNDLQQMINDVEVAGGGEVWVKFGIYIPDKPSNDLDLSNPNTAIQARAFCLRKNVKVYAGFAGTENSLVERVLNPNNPTVLSGIVAPSVRAYHVVVSAGNVGTACLDGFTIRDGECWTQGTVSAITVNGESIYNHFGGGIVVQNSSPLLKKLIIEGNFSNHGGGIACINSYPVIEEVDIRNNSAASGNCHGGGMYLKNSKPSLSDVKINNNFALSGGGLYLEQCFFLSNLIMTCTNTVIFDNTAEDGGGIYVNNSFCELSGVVVSGNQAFTPNSIRIGTLYGGGIYIADNQYFKLCNSVVSNNKAENNGDFTHSTSGGGIYVENNTLCHLINVLITGNQADYGGAVYANGGSDNRLINVTICGNTDDEGLQGVYCTNSSYLPIYNSILYGNNSTNLPNSINMNIEYSLVQNYTTSANHNLVGTTNPQFVNAANKDYRLTYSSPCRNAGFNGYNPKLNKLDLAGNPRWGEDNVDMGAYEHKGHCPNGAGVLFVKKGGAGAQDGSSWADAINEFSTALQAASTNTSIHTIFVSDGIYYPTTKTGFILPDNVEIYGGFPLSADDKKHTDTSSRQISKSLGTILSGNIGGNVPNNNCYHVVVASNSSHLDGFFIREGIASEYGTDIINGITVPQNRGAGMYVIGNAILRNLEIWNNWGQYGAGMAIMDGCPYLENITIHQNLADFNGGGIYCERANLHAKNTHIFGNYADKGGGIYSTNMIENVNSVVPIFENVSIYKNLANMGGGIFNESSTLLFLNALLYDNSGVFGGGTLYNDFSRIAFVQSTMTANNPFPPPPPKPPIVPPNLTPIYQGYVMLSPTMAGIETGNPLYAYNSIVCLENFQLLTGIHNHHDPYGNCSFLFIDPLNGNFSLHAIMPAPPADLYNNIFNHPEVEIDTFLRRCSFPTNLLQTDIAGNPRITNGQSNCGAYEQPISKPPKSISYGNEEDEETQNPPALSQKASEEKLQVYPTPTTGQLTITMDNGQLTMDNVEIYSVVGQKLNNYQLSTVNYQLIIDVSHLANGMYYLRVGNKVVKFVKN